MVISIGQKTGEPQNGGTITGMAFTGKGQGPMQAGTQLSGRRFQGAQAI